VRTSGSKGTAAAALPAAVGIQAIAVTPATSNSKDDSNSMTAHNSRNAATASMKATTATATANTIETSAKAWMLGKVVNQQNEGRPTTVHTLGTLLTSEMTAAAGMPT
jgi:cysteine synthase